MAEFKFRATAALELRKQQETTAAAALSVAEAELRLAEKRVEEAEVSRRVAQEQQVHVERNGSDIATITWHRNWVVRLAGSIVTERQEMSRRGAIVDTAEEAWREARRKRLALERMRDRALRRFKDEERRQEMKVIDELARLRFLAAEEP